MTQVREAPARAQSTANTVMTVAYPGAAGAFAHLACLRFLPEHEPVAVALFADVVQAVVQGATEFGILPIWNNQAGETGARGLIENAALDVVDEAVLPVRMCLLGMPCSTLEGIETVVSHPVALRQCARKLAELGAATEESVNTAIAAKSLTEPNRAVLASEEAAEVYGLIILMRDVHDRDDNATRFAVFARHPR